MYNDEMLNCLMENQDNGIIFINRDGNIAAINTKAKRLFGVVSDAPISFPSDKIKKGDIVIICDSQIGEDDGNLMPEDLYCIGVQDSKLKEDDTLLVIGKYQTKGSLPRYKFSSSARTTGVMSLTDNVFGHKILARIDFNNRNATIVIDGNTFGMSFISSIGFMVILDSETNKVKFVHSNGYTMRKEGIKEILSGKVYSESSSGSELDIIGKPFNEFFDLSESEFSIDELLQEDETEERNVTAYIVNSESRFKQKINFFLAYRKSSWWFCKRCVV